MPQGAALGRTRSNHHTLHIAHPRSPLAIVVPSNDNGVPERIYLGPPVVHDSRQPGMDGFRAVTVTISQQLLIDSNLGRNFTQLRKAGKQMDERAAAHLQRHHQQDRVPSRKLFANTALREVNHPQKNN